MGGKEGRAAIAPRGLPACDGRRCLAHAGGGRILFPGITIPCGAPSVYQRNTDLSVRFGLARVSVSALHGIRRAKPEERLQGCRVADAVIKAQMPATLGLPTSARGAGRRPRIRFAGYLRT